MDPRLELTQEQYLDFWSKVDYTLLGCWLWTGRLANSWGYGGACYNGLERSAHRRAFELFYSADLADTRIKVCHSCDNPLCVNPNHLFLGSDKDNNHDMYTKRRGYTVLSETVVARIKYLKCEGLAQKEIAARLNLSVGTVNKVINNKHTKFIK